MQLIEGYLNCRTALEHSAQARAFSNREEIEATVREICEAVRHEGDAALLRYERQFDCPTLEVAGLRVTETEIEDAWRELDPKVRQALQRAADNIESFHRKQPTGDWHATSPDGAFVGQRFTPLECVGLYAPGGRAVYPSSVLMLAIPARVAGVDRVVLASPPARDGSLHPMILAAARIAGVDEIYKMGGAPAMAAFAYGTDSVPRVDKLVGPGNLYVTLAKKYLYGTVGIDGLYGPSEVAIIADINPKGRDPELATQVAADLIAQAEHEPEAWVCLIANSRRWVESVLVEIEKQVVESPRREILRESLPKGFALCVDSMHEACKLCDVAAAEHVEIWSRDALSLSAKIRHAGAVFLNTPVPVGDYIAGPSHTLPTGGTSRFSHGVDVGTFLKRTSLVAASQPTLAALVDDLETLALLEQLPGHAAAVRRAASAS